MEEFTTLKLSQDMRTSGKAMFLETLLLKDPAARTWQLAIRDEMVFLEIMSPPMPISAKKI